MIKKINYQKYLKENPFHKKLGINIDNYGQFDKKKTKGIYGGINEQSTPFEAELDDLIRLHYLVTSRKVTTILEFGVGKSTVVFDDALEKNKLLYSDFVKNNLRRGTPFQCFSVDNNKKWLNEVKKKYHTQNIIFNYSKCEMGTFNNRICTYYNNLPNICPDFIYLDAPDQFSPTADIRGISTRHVDRLPMSADILAIEHFLLPGTLIVVDGRSANARFLMANFQRNWKYKYEASFDQHFFELLEKPIGKLNKKQIDFCLKNKSFQ